MYTSLPTKYRTTLYFCRSTGAQRGIRRERVRKVACMQNREPGTPNSIPLHAEMPDALIFQQEQLEQLTASGHFQTTTDALPMIDPKNAEHQLMQQEQIIQLQAELIELAHDAILIRDLDNRIVSWNQGAEALYGWTVEEAVGQVTHTLLHTQFSTSRELVEKALAEYGYWEGRLIHINRAGAQVIVESRQVLARDVADQPRYYKAGAPRSRRGGDARGLACSPGNDAPDG